MDFEFGSVLGAIAIIAIPLIAWLSPRLTHQGRLLGRISRLSAAYQAMPPSTERDRLGEQITSLGAQLLEWIDGDTHAHRVVRHWLNAIIFMFAIGTAFAVNIQLHPDPTVALIVNLGLGFAAGVLMVITTEWLDRRAARRRKVAAQEARAAAFRRGEGL
ncbi:hypothetical protein [Microbacterium sp. JZ31]|uniref:hypothetical protein n=1 Tax=Microbacterium sp. JZ31 TaxID=1906274 RepID=UPI0019324C4A|nr:hypothetical protein [Microbacterium sp. JZ31]